MIPYVVTSVRVDEGTQGPTVYDQPSDEGAERLWIEDVHFEHADWMGTYGTFEDFVDAEFRDCD